MSDDTAHQVRERGSSLEGGSLERGGAVAWGGGEDKLSRGSQNGFSPD